MNRPVVFSGPSLKTEDRQDSRFEFRAPAKQGDIIRAVAQGAPAIGIIDGYFGNVLSVHQKEILEALSEGIPVLGAASMGALRAAELAPFGMVGIGGIYEDYAAGRLVSDADVAVAHAPAAFAYAATSVSLVDLRATLEVVREEGFSSSELEQLWFAAESLHFIDRTWARIAARCPALSFDAASFLQLRHVERKRNDALALLGAMSKPLSPPLRPTLPLTIAYDKIRRRALASP